MFGSQARRDATTHSDIDVMIVLSGEIDIPQENKRLSEFVAALCLEYDVSITHVAFAKTQRLLSKYHRCLDRVIKETTQKLSLRG
ncbi:MAG: nucleotidyltransferase domain-containing protein [Phormidesmis sp.]